MIMLHYLQAWLVYYEHKLAQLLMTMIFMTLKKNGSANNFH